MGTQIINQTIRLFGYYFWLLSRTLILLLLVQPVYIHCWMDPFTSSFHFERSISNCCQYVPTVLLMILVYCSSGLTAGLAVGGPDFTFPHNFKSSAYNSFVDMKIFVTSSMNKINNLVRRL